MGGSRALARLVDASACLSCGCLLPHRYDKQPPRQLSHWERFAVAKPHHDTMARRRLCSVLWCQASKYFKNKKKFIRKKIKTEMNT
jgi:hypothetical protein